MLFYNHLQNATKYPHMESIGLQTIDYVIIIVYLVRIVWYGLKKGKQQSSEDYFLTGRNMT